MKRWRRRTVGIARRLQGAALVLALLPSSATTTHPQEASRPVELVNGNMESLDAAGALVGWRAPQTLLDAGYAIGPEHEDVFEGERAARIDSSAVEPGGNLFGNLVQSVDATPYREKRVRFRAAVKMSDAHEGGRAQLWLRVDLASTGGAPRVGFFDNMGDRPIQSSDWQHYEIVGDVAADAEAIVFGVMSLGKCVVLADDASLEIVSAEVAPTGAMDALASAPTQPFFTWWLVLPGLGLALFALAYLSRSRLGKFAFEFTFVYWALYVFSALLAGVVPFVGATWSRAFEAGPMDAAVRWSAAHVLGIEGELVSAIDNGSGDTTYSYVQALMSFVLALAVAVVWSLVDRRRTDHPRLKDVLTSALRYYLAATLLGYGLAKIGVLYNQFPEPGSDRLAETYGSSSPMGILWTFMGSSRAYTAFSGYMEAVCALLLLWRRTALLGALTSICVMTNVMVINFCYDTPVKLFSFHLVLVAACIALPHASRLAHVFCGIGAGTPSALAFPFTGKAWRWTHALAKAYLVLMVAVLPLYRHFRLERAVAPVAPALREWKLATLEVGGQPVADRNGEVAWLAFFGPVQSDTGWTTQYYATVTGGSPFYGTSTLTPDTLALTGGPDTSRLFPGEYGWSSVADGMRLEGTRDGAPVRATFVRAANDFLLMRRGFRWINEQPFNR